MLLSSLSDAIASSVVFAESLLFCSASAFSISDVDDACGSSDCGSSDALVRAGDCSVSEEDACSLPLGGGLLCR